MVGWSMRFMTWQLKLNINSDVTAAIFVALKLTLIEDKNFHITHKNLTNQMKMWICKHCMYFLHSVIILWWYHDDTKNQKMLLHYLRNVTAVVRNMVSQVLFRAFTEISLYTKITETALTLQTRNWPMLSRPLALVTYIQ